MTYLFVRRKRNKALFGYAPGSTSATPTFTRATTATYTDVNGITRTAPINTLRDGHYIGGVRTTLLEAQRTNSALWSWDLTNAAWGISGAGARTLDAVGINGSANSATTLTDTDAALNTSEFQNVAIANDSATHAVTGWFRKDTDQTRFPSVGIWFTGGTSPGEYVVMLNTQTGAAAAASSVAGAAFKVTDAGLWWTLTVTCPNNALGNANLRAEIYPALGTVLGTVAAATTGSCVVGQVQVELNSSFCSSPIFTTTTAVTRGGDVLVIPISFAEQPLTMYTKCIDLGSQATGTAGVMSVGDFAVRPSVLLTHTNTAQLAGTFNNGTSSFNTGNVTTGIAIGDTVEYRGTFDATGILAPFVSRNGAGEVTSTPSVTLVYGAGWGGGVVRIGNYNGTAAASAFAAFRSVKIASGIRSLAEMRAL